MQVRYDLSLARFYMWAQTEAMVYVAVHVPTGAPASLIYAVLLKYLPFIT